MSEGKFQVPGVFWVAIILMLPPAIAPIISQFFPTNTYLWSAGVVALLNVIVIAVRISWPKESANVPTALGAPAPDGTVQPVKQRSTASKFLLGC